MERLDSSSSAAHITLAFAVIALGTGLAFKVDENLHWGIFAWPYSQLLHTKYCPIMPTILAMDCGVQMTTAPVKNGLLRVV